MIQAAALLQTERLVLRPHDWSDFPAYLAVMQSERARFMGGPMSLKQAWFCFASDVAHWPLKGCGALAVTLRDFAARSLGWRTLVSYISAGNTRSARLPERLGATCEGTFIHERHGVMDVWLHPAPAALMGGAA